MRFVWRICSLVLLFDFFLTACVNENTLTVDNSLINIAADGGAASFTINTDAESWSITNSESWLVLSATSGNSAKAMVSVVVNSKSIEERVATLTITAGNADPLTLSITQSASSYLYSMSANNQNILLTQSGSSVSFILNTDAPQWTISTNENWLSVDPFTGIGTNARIYLSAEKNNSQEARNATITIEAEYAQSLIINITQTGELFPSYNTSPAEPIQSGMESCATQLAKNMFAGWNMGNSLEVPGNETLWGNPKATQQLIDSVYRAGFNTVRLPCAWNSYIEDTQTWKIKESWLARVKEVVDYCYKNNMYVMLNIHWDGGWLENNCIPSKQEINNAKQKALWEQIATYFRDYDEHLLFAGTNEPNAGDVTEMKVLLSYEQTFIDAVRSTGGRNAYRVLIFQGPYTDIDKTNNLMTSLPNDKAVNRLMAEVHYYTPWNFCGLEEDATWGKMFYYWGQGFHSTTDTQRNANWGEESTVRSNFSTMKTKFVNKGIPVVLGEYAALRRTDLSGSALELHLASRAYYYKYVTEQAKNNGLIPMVWDNGGLNNHACGIFNRNYCTVFDKQVLDAIMDGAKAGQYPF